MPKPRLLPKDPSPAIAADSFRLMIETAPDGFFIHDADGHILDVNDQSCTDLGYSRRELLGLTINDISCGTPPLVNVHNWTMAPPGSSRTIDETALRKDGSTFPVQISVTCQLIEGRKLFLGLARDMTESRHHLSQEHGRLHLAARVGGLGIWDYDIESDRLHCDAQWYAIMGRDPATPVRSVGDFRSFIHPDDVERATEVKMMAAHLATSGEDYSITFRIIRPNGEIRWVRSAACLAGTAAGAPQRAVGFVVDITDSRLAEEALRISNIELQAEKRRLAQHSAQLERQTLEDALTGVGNRRAFDRAFNREWRHAMRSGQPLALAMVDVDHFKLYNDRYGHAQGDLALKAVARALSLAAQRPHDLVARYGGEEFVVLLPGGASLATVLERATAELARLALPHAASPISEVLTMSCGCVVAASLAGLEPGDLIALSDQALYRAKQAGRNRITISQL
ncbi:MAG: diguanylate cyclase [Hyphomicrobiales bacterium]|nr:MAG: diguanylate cyclase [Hyphomicrobiales bacterium]